MLAMIFGAALGAASKDAGSGAENAITFVGLGMLAYISLMFLHLKRQRDQNRERRIRK
jgi:hypothetical protein